MNNRLWRTATVLEQKLAKQTTHFKDITHYLFVAGSFKISQMSAFRHQSFQQNNWTDKIGCAPFLVWFCWTITTSKRHSWQLISWMNLNGIMWWFLCTMWERCHGKMDSIQFHGKISHSMTVNACAHTCLFVHLCPHCDWQSLVWFQIENTFRFSGHTKNWALGCNPLSNEQNHCDSHLISKSLVVGQHFFAYLQLHLLTHESPLSIFSIFMLNLAILKLYLCKFLFCNVDHYLLCQMCPVLLPSEPCSFWKM